MKNNVAVFILIILVASSFKYRSKTVVSTSAPPHDNIALKVLALPEKTPASAFTALTDKMNEANQELAGGDGEAVKALWAHTDDVTIFCSSSGVEVKGWKAVEERLDWICSQIVPGSTYTYETISSQEGEHFGTVQQTEHYQAPDGKTRDLGVTILFKKERDGWKIIHRHAENLSSRVALK